MEFDGPSHFLACRSAKGLTLMKRRHLELLGYRLVSVPFWVSCRLRCRGMATLLLLMARLHCCVVVAAASSCFAHLARAHTQIISGADSVHSTDFGTRYLQEWDQLTERDKREEYLRGKLHMS